MVYTRPLISKSSSPFINPLVTVPNALIIMIIGITITFMSRSFFSDKDETINNIISEGSELMQKEYQIWFELAGKIIL